MTHTYNLIEAIVSSGYEKVNERKKSNIQTGCYEKAAVHLFSFPFKFR